MTELPEEGYNLEEMNEDEKDEAINTLGQAYNETMAIAASLHNALVLFSVELGQGDKPLQRMKTMRLVALKMQIMARLTLPALVSEDSYEQMQTDSTFEDIVNGLDLDEE